MPIFLILCLLLLPTPVAAMSLSERLAQAADNAEQISNQLLMHQPDTLTAEDWLVLTEAQLRLRNKEAAMDAVNHVLQQQQPPYLQAYGYLLKAQIYGILYRDTAIAITQLEQAEMLLQHAADNDSLALYSDVLQNFAQAYNQLGNIPKAIPYAEQSLALALRQQQADAELKARITLGRLTLQNNAYSQAFSHLQQALTLAGQLNDEDALASIHLRLGMAYRKIDYHAQALQHLHQAKQRYQALQRQSSYTYTLIYIGETYLEDNATASDAASYLTEALTLARQLNDLPRVGVATLGLGRLAALQQQNELALQYFNEAQQLFRQQNVQTYLQETSLELAELLRQQQQFPQAMQLLQELEPDMPQAAAYLRYRYHELAARLQAQQHDWAKAYANLQLANTLRFDEQKTQNKLQLDLMERGLAQAGNNSQLQAELNAQQHLAARQQRYIQLLSAAVLLLLLAVLLLSVRQRKRTSALSVTLPVTADWNQFCQRIQQAPQDNIQLLTFCPSGSQQLKQYYAEQRLQQALRELLQQLPDHAVQASCWQDDVLWLAVAGSENTLAQRHADIRTLLQQQLPAGFSDKAIFSLRLPLNQLLQKPWQLTELSALREAFWLCRALVAAQPGHTSQRLITLRSQQHKACEWRSTMVRQDLLNAIRLGSVQLEADGIVLPATIADNLS